MSLPPPRSRSPSRDRGYLSRLAQSSIQSLPLTGAHSACRWTRKRKRLPSVPPRSLGKAWELLPELPAPTRAGQQVSKSPMAPFTPPNWVNETLCETINAQTSGNPGPPFPQPREALHTQVTLCPGLGPTASLPDGRAKVDAILGVCPPRGFGQGENSHYITISTLKVFIYSQVNYLLKYHVWPRKYTCGKCTIAFYSTHAPM